MGKEGENGRGGEAASAVASQQEGPGLCSHVGGLSSLAPIVMFALLRAGGEEI